MSKLTARAPKPQPMAKPSLSANPPVRTSEPETRVIGLGELAFEAILLGLAVGFTFLCANVGGLEGLLAGLIAWAYVVYHIRWWRRLR